MLLVLFKKFLGKREAFHPAQDSPNIIEEKVVRIQEGDLKLRNQVITDYQPYIAKVTSRFCKRYIDPAHDDEYSIALNAFNEAINKFSTNSGSSFLSFAETVIRRRLIDYVRKEQRFSKQLPYSSFEVEDEEESVINPVEIHRAVEQFEIDKSAEERRQEIMELQRSLLDFGISFFELPDISPKHEDSRKMLFDIGRKLAEDSAMIESIKTKKMLPIKELLDVVQVSRKTLERHRKYLIAITLILEGPYTYLREYLHIPQASEEGRKQNDG